MKIILAAFVLISSMILPASAQSADYYHILTVRYDYGIVKHFLGGPYRGQRHCNKLAQTVWDSVVTTCGKCKREHQSCSSAASVPELYKRTFRNEVIPIPYVGGLPNNRILFAGLERASAVRECQHTAAEARRNGYPQAVCISQ